jgi:peptidoglycan/xylan/chitin deacetylase (PgdA/CDA1 family)
MGKVTLTFDNGPEPDVTPAVLDCLNRHGVKATFFVLGRKVSLPERRAISERASEEGHWIGNHTFTHGPSLGKLDRPTALREFEEGALALSWLDQPRRLFRPHGGGILGPHLLNPAVVEGLQAGGYSCVLWNSVPGDWREPDGWLQRGLDDCRKRDWSLVVLHDLPNGAMAYLDRFIGGLRDDGFEFVQDYPPECVPIVGGKIVLPIEPYVTATA